MEKVIYINMGGRVIPIEEKAAAKLEAYFEKLKSTFTKEEGATEILEDIESRFSEHFQEKLDLGKACIQQTDVAQVIEIMGHPEDFEDNPSDDTLEEPKIERRFYRNNNDKVVAGVCSGLADFFAIDPVFVRIIFVVAVIGGLGIGVLVYLLLWILVPLKSATENRHSKLFRSRDNRILAGVSGGLGHYFGISPNIPRLIFLFPFVLSIFSGLIFFPFGVPGMILTLGSLGSSVVIIYLIMWFVIPEAKTRTQKMQMQREEVNIQNIIKTVKEDAKIIRDKASTQGKKLGEEMEEMASQLKNNFEKNASKFKNESLDFSKKAEQKAKQMEQELKDSLNRKDNPLIRFLTVVGFIVMGLVFVTFLLLFLGSVFFATLAEPFLSYITYTEADKWLFYAIVIGFPFLLFWSSGFGLVKMFTGKNIALTVVNVITTFLWIGLISSVVFLTWNYSKNYRYKMELSNEILMKKDSEISSRITIKSTTLPKGFRLFSYTNKMMMKADTLYLKNVSYKITRTDDSLLRVFAEGDVFHHSTQSNLNLLTTHEGLKWEGNTLYLPSYSKLLPGEKLNTKHITYHIHLPKNLEYEADFF